MAITPTEKYLSKMVNQLVDRADFLAPAAQEHEQLMAILPHLRNAVQDCSRIEPRLIKPRAPLPEVIIDEPQNVRRSNKEEAYQFIAARKKPVTSSDLTAALGCTPNSANTVLARLLRDEKIIRVSRGVYAIPGIKAVA